MNKKLWYVAHPYTSKNGITIEDNLRNCNAICNNLIDKGYLIYSPITISHQFHLLKERCPDFWYEYDLEIMKKCNGIILCSHWEESKGCLLEYKEALKLKLEIRFYQTIWDHYNIKEDD